MKKACDPCMANSLRLYQPMEGNTKRTIQDLLTNPLKVYTKLMRSQEL
jgi:hypothetical protein